VREIPESDPRQTLVPSTSLEVASCRVLAERRRRSGAVPPGRIDGGATASSTGFSIRTNLPEALREGNSVRPLVTGRRQARAPSPRRTTVALCPGLPRFESLAGGPGRPTLCWMRRVAAIAFGALLLAGSASASRSATKSEYYWMSGTVNSPVKSFTWWARVSTVNPHYGVVYLRQCSEAARCGTNHTHPLAVYLLRRRRLTARAWGGSLQAQAMLRPPYGVNRLCRSAPRAVRQDLLATICPT